MPGLRSSLPFAALLVLAPAASLAAPLDLDALAARVRTLVEALVAADTENPPGNEARAVAVGAARLRAEGISFETFEFAPGRSNLIVRLKGDGTEKPLLLLAHIDVVPTAGQPWTVPTHKVTVKGDRLYGRGVYDDLSMAAAELEVAILLAKARVPLRRDVIVAWTGGDRRGRDPLAARQSSRGDRRRGAGSERGRELPPRTGRKAVPGGVPGRREGLPGLRRPGEGRRWPLVRAAPRERHRPARPGARPDRPEPVSSETRPGRAHLVR
jgi:hypothetical protein